MVDEPAVEVALERDDEVGELLGLDPAPFAELGMLGGDVRRRCRCRGSGTDTSPGPGRSTCRPIICRAVLRANRSAAAPGNRPAARPGAAQCRFPPRAREARSPTAPRPCRSRPAASARRRRYYRSARRPNLFVGVDQHHADPAAVEMVVAHGSSLRRCAANDNLRRMIERNSLLRRRGRAAEPDPLVTFKDWTAGCDNGRSCMAVGQSTPRISTSPRWWSSAGPARGSPVIWFRNDDKIIDLPPTASGWTSSSSPMRTISS